MQQNAHLSFFHCVEVWVNMTGISFYFIFLPWLVREHRLDDHSPPASPNLFTSTDHLTYFAKYVIICITFILTLRFWSLKHKSDVRRQAHGAWRLLADSSKITLLCKKTSKCVNAKLIPSLKRYFLSSFSHTHSTQNQMPLIDDLSVFGCYNASQVCFLLQPYDSFLFSLYFI